MSLVSSDIADLIRECKLYGNTYENNSFNKVDFWRNKPLYTYHPMKKCRLLQEARLNRNPSIPENDTMNIYDYRTLQPITHTGIREYFSGNSKSQNDYIITTLFIVIMAIIFSMI